uniref:BHLH domain-containing protein n=1 Tax=Salix viminalis TaxID=40686 RepID=A0A6N2LRP7_SALVM
MEACSWNSTRVQVSGFEGMSGGFLVKSGLQAKTRAGSSSTSALVLDNERGELVEATVRMERKVVSAERSIAALKNHSEAEKKRRARINALLDTLRSLVPGTSKNLIRARADVMGISQVGVSISLVFLVDVFAMDKASLLAEVITHLKQLKIQATEASEGLLMPLDIDELRVERQEGGLHGGPCVITASICCDCKPGVLSDLRQELDALHLIIMRAEIATLEGRMRNVFVMSSCNGGGGDTKAHQFRGGAIHQALRSILDKFSASPEFSLKSTLSNKRRRVGLFKPSLSSSSGDLW